MTSGLYIYQLWVKNELLLCYALLSKCVTCLADSRLPVCECLCHIEMVLYCFIVEPKTVVEIAVKQWSYLFQKEIRPGKMESTEFCLINEINLWVLTNCPTSTIHLKPITFPPVVEPRNWKNNFLFQGKGFVYFRKQSKYYKIYFNFFLSFRLYISLEYGFRDYICDVSNELKRSSIVSLWYIHY